MTSNIDQLIAETKRYLSLHITLYKLEGVEVVVRLASALLLVVVLIVLMACALFYLMFALVYILHPYVGSFALSYLLVGSIYILLMMGVIVGRKRLIVSPLVRFVSQLFFHNPPSNPPL